MILTLQLSHIFLVSNRIHWFLKSVVALINCVLNRRIIEMSTGFERPTYFRIEPSNLSSTRATNAQDCYKIFNLQPALNAVPTSYTSQNYYHYHLIFDDSLLDYAAAPIVFTQNESNSNKHKRWSKPHSYGRERRISPTLHRI